MNANQSKQEQQQVVAKFRVTDSKQVSQMFAMARAMPQHEFSVEFVDDVFEVTVSSK